MALEGGLRDRMILESVLRDIEAYLTTLDWFDAGREHKPITIIDEYPAETDEVPLNTMAFSFGDISTVANELGSPSETMYVPIYIDFFAESDGLGRHVIGDIHTHVAKQGQFTVYDYSQAIPPAEFVVQVNDGSIDKRKPTRAVNAWQKNWHVISFVVLDERSNA